MLMVTVTLHGNIEELGGRYCSIYNTGTVTAWVVVAATTNEDCIYK
jgi:hypothetical protein